MKVRTCRFLIGVVLYQDELRQRFGVMTKEMYNDNKNINIVYKNSKQLSSTAYISVKCSLSH